MPQEQDGWRQVSAWGNLGSAFIKLTIKFKFPKSLKKPVIYFENASRGEEGFNTHLVSYTLCISMSNFLDRDFYFDFEIPCSTPPVYASRDEYKGKFDILLKSKRSLVSDLVRVPARRKFEIERKVENKIPLQMLFSHFLTTEELKEKYFDSIIWNSFAVGRICLTREQLRTYDLIEWTHSKLVNPSFFYFLGKTEKQALLETVKISYEQKIEDLAAEITAEIGDFYAMHLRLGDFLENYREDEYSVQLGTFKKYVRATFPDDSRPVLVATDGLYEKKMFAELLDGYEVLFIDEIVFENFRNDYESLEFTDFNVLSIINQILCANAKIFIGTYRSTFTSVIHRLRQERNNFKDFNFFPDGKVAALLNSAQKISRDKSGFFDWNTYSVFAENHMTMGWMREWDFERTSLEL